MQWLKQSGGETIQWLKQSGGETIQWLKQSEKKKRERPTIDNRTLQRKLNIEKEK
jgi:hypothetical protein